LNELHDTSDHQGAAGGGGALPLLVITGAAGRIGTFYRAHLAQAEPRWRLRLTDIRDIPDPRGADVVTGNFADLPFACSVLEGADALLHLAADPSPSADYYASLLERNVTAAYNAFEAAARAKIRRHVFASSVNAINGYPEDLQVHTSMLARPGNVYGATKVWGEALAAAYAAQGRLSTICVRIGGIPRPGERPRPEHPRTLAMFVTERDLCHLFDCCLRVGGIDFAVVHGQSANRFTRMEIETTRRLVGYEPQDDVFAIAEG